tara:strand:- start:16236 stop:17285 length:1050 start_codon:yes stop_codon:yes gene_type:complete
LTEKLRLGWVGSGFVGQVAHLANYCQLPNVEITGLAELRPELGQLACEKYGIPNYFKDHTHLMDNQVCDAIVAIVRREHTASVALDILERGLPVFTEKPMAATVAQGASLVKTAREKNCLYVNGFMRRYDEGVQIAKNLISHQLHGGELGEPLFFRCYCFGGGDYCNISGFWNTSEPTPKHKILPIAPDWVPKQLKQEYERFLNVFVHDINLIRYLTDKKPKIHQVNYRKNSGSIALDFDQFQGVFEFAHLETNRYWEEGVEILFSKGRIVLQLPPAFLRNQPATVQVFHEDVNGATSMQQPKADWTWSFKRQAEAFVDCLLTNGSSLSPGSDSLEDLELIEEIWSKIV